MPSVNIVNGKQIVVEEVAHGEIGQIFHLRKLKSRIGVTLIERRLEDLLAQDLSAVAVLANREAGSHLPSDQ